MKSAVVFLIIIFEVVFTARIQSRQHFKFGPKPEKVATSLQKTSPDQRALDNTPINTLGNVGANIVFECSAPVGSNLRIQWWEWASTSTTTKQPQMISDQTLMVEHPNKARYTIQHPNSDTYNLAIQNIQLSDGGTYTCLDAAYGPPGCYNTTSGQSGSSVSAELVVINGSPTCYSTIGSTGEVLENAYHTIDCALYYGGNAFPTISWSGPQPYDVYRQNSVGYTWSAIEITINRSMQDRFFESTTQLALADQTLIYNYTYTTALLDVYWGPQSLKAEPIKEFYYVGNTIKCSSDANPIATYNWQNTQNGDFFPGDTFIIEAKLVGMTWTLRCQAKNVIFGTTYSENIAINVTVVDGVESTLPPETTGSTVSYCNYSSGMVQWQNRQSSIARYFNKTWNEYVQGFSHPSFGCWIGLENLVQLTSSRTCGARFDIQGTTGTWYYSSYSYFFVDAADTRYRLTFSGYSGNAGDFTTYHNNGTFNTYDSDFSSSLNGASTGGGFWYGSHGTGPTCSQPHFHWNTVGTNFASQLEYASISVFC